MSLIEDKAVGTDSEVGIGRRRSCLTGPFGAEPSRSTVQEQRGQSGQETKHAFTAPIGVITPVNWSSRRKRRSRGTKVVNVIGSYSNPWKLVKDEMKKIDDGFWSPTIDDFTVVATSKRKNEKRVECKTVDQFLAIIYRYRPGSVKRVNIFTHGDRMGIGFYGKVDQAGTVTFHSHAPNTQSVLGTSLDGKSLAKARNPSQWWQCIIRKRLSKRYYLKDVLKRFAKGAEIVLYACRSGVDPTLLKDIATTFKVPVRGFSQKIAFCPKHNNISIDRSRMGIDNCKNPTKDYRTLKPDRVQKP